MAVGIAPGETRRLFQAKRLISADALVLETDPNLEERPVQVSLVQQG
jgi:hypothetical protein